MASRHSTGVTYSLARNSCLSTSMRLECAICGRGRNFHGPQRDAAWLFLTVFIALPGFPHGVFPLRPDVRDSPSAPRLTAAAKATALSWGTADPPRFASWSVWPDVSHCTGMNNTRFRWTLQYIFVYTAGPSTFQESSSSDSKVSVFHARWREKKYCSSHFIELWNEYFITEPTTSTQARTRIARMGVGTLNQSTSRDGYTCIIIRAYFFAARVSEKYRYRIGYFLEKSIEKCIGYKFWAKYRYRNGYFFSKYRDGHW